MGWVRLSDTGPGCPGCRARPGQGRLKVLLLSDLPGILDRVSNRPVLVYAGMGVSARAGARHGALLGAAEARRPPDGVALGVSRPTADADLPRAPCARAAGRV